MSGVTWDHGSLRDLSRALRRQPQVIRDKVGKVIQEAADEVEPAVQASARSTLPGRLGEWAAAITVDVDAELTGAYPKITVKGHLDNKTRPRGGGRTRRAGTFGKADLRALNRGRVMHPVWGRGPLVGPQSVKPGFWDEPLKGKIGDEAIRKAKAALDEAVADLARDAQ